MDQRSLNLRQISVDQWPGLSLFCFVDDCSSSSIIVVVLFPRLATEQHFFLHFLLFHSCFQQKTFSVMCLAKMKFCPVAISMCGAMEERQTFSSCTVLEGEKTRLMVI